jgi:hypothetical protein
LGFEFLLWTLSSTNMTTSEKPAQRQLLAMSPEAMIGTGITIASLGLLGLLLGWAQQMREVQTWATVWFALGAVLAIVGLLVVAVAAARKRRP